jgi:hypothetical protein
MDWRQRLADYHRAKAEFARAGRLLANTLVRHDPARRAGDQPTDPMILGVALARWRALRASRRLMQATFKLTYGRPLDEVLWSLPDDI